MLNIEYEYPDDISFLEITSTWARNQNVRVSKSIWHPTQFTSPFQCLFFLTSPKKEFVSLVTKVVQFVSVQKLSSIPPPHTLHFWNSSKEDTGGLNSFTLEEFYFSDSKVMIKGLYISESPNTYTLHIVRMQLFFLMSLIWPTGFESDKQEVVQSKYKRKCFKLRRSILPTYKLPLLC